MGVENIALRKGEKRDGSYRAKFTATAAAIIFDIDNLLLLNLRNKPDKLFRNIEV